MLAGAVLFAQPKIDGTWYFEQVESGSTNKEGATGDVTMNMTMVFVFSGSSYNISVDLDADMTVSGKDKEGNQVDAVMKITAKGSNNGALTQSGDLFTMTPGKDKVKVEVDADVNGLPGGGLFKTMMTPLLKKEVSAILKEESTFKVLSVTDTELTIQDVLTEKEIAKGEVPETMVLKKK